MLGLSKKSSEPTTFYALAFCVHIVAFILMAIGIFTPFWSENTETDAANTAEFIYDKGLILICLTTGSCEPYGNISSQSDAFVAAFVFGILAIILGFFILQFLLAGQCIKSCRESNLGIPIATLSIIEGALLILVLVLFEISLDKDVLATGNIHREDTFGFSRGLIIGAAILYWVAAFFIIGEYVRRQGSGPLFEEFNGGMTRTRNGPHQRPPENYIRAGGSRKQPIVNSPIVAAGAPPPYTKGGNRGNSVVYGANSGYGGNPVYADTVGIYHSRYTGMMACLKPFCSMCDHVAETYTFWGPGGVFNINERFICQDGNVVYAIICLKDEKVFIGHSKDRLEETLKVHIGNIKNLNRRDPVAVHFSAPGHTSQDLRITALARLNCDSDTRARLEKALSYDMDRPHHSYYGINENFVFL